jgi:hypothetical protein
MATATALGVLGSDSGIHMGSAHGKLAYREVGTITVQEAIEVWPK